MDPTYIIKIKITLDLDIKNPIATWVLARLFDEEIPIGEKDLVKNLCKASFALMTDDDDFDKVMDQLKEAEYVDVTEQEVTEFVPIPSSSFLPTDREMKEVTKIRTGYVITKKGIIAFRRQIVTPIEKIKPHMEKPSAYKTEKFKNIIETLKSQPDVLKSSIKLCIDNAPLVLEFIKTLIAQLPTYGININLG